MKKFKTFMCSLALIASLVSMTGCTADGEETSSAPSYTLYTITNASDANLKMYENGTFVVSGSYNYRGTYVYSGNYQGCATYAFYDESKELIANGRKRGKHIALDFG